MKPSIENLCCLIKFVPEKYVKSVMDEGLLYMNTLKYFRTYEDSDEALRGDKYEGLSASFLPDQIHISVNGNKIDGIIGKVDVRPHHVDEIKLFCMTALTHDILFDGFVLDRRFANFGDKAIIIEGKGLVSFFQMLRNRVKDDQSVYAIDSTFKTNGFVEYVDRNHHHKELTVFHKFKEYSWQHEFRIAFERPEHEGPFPLYIGSLKDIAYVKDTKEVLETKYSLKGF
ncbi:hypothetical protein [Pseudoalteromonas piratica]|uniref:Uncharacterized protein n=1 Tax=Pseudoalteromonas piratica TaxID=1348114 RepID=A0A0A7EKC6_9GAMM|nr:hypothetical protein [Pseudoalteromonas piratica]AIY67079.1 hypothetical protein OM33_18570 [Pseudoalteromonas piratica]